MPTFLYVYDDTGVVASCRRPHRSKVVFATGILIA
jgi:hypothetical protein